VHTLQKQLADLHQQLRLNFEGDTCLAALAADLFQGTWISIDKVTQTTTFGPQNQVQSYGSCEDLASPGVPRASEIGVPPTIKQLIPLLKWLG
jgi:hypothetical protein